VQGGRDSRYPVVGQQKGTEPSQKRKVAQCNEGVVRKVNGVMLVLWDLSDVQVKSDQSPTLVTPRFSIAGILYPVYITVDENTDIG